MKKGKNKLLISIALILIIALIISTYSFAAIEGGITNENAPNLIGASITERGEEVQEKMVWHNNNDFRSEANNTAVLRGETYVNIIKNDEQNLAELSATERIYYLNLFNELENSCIYSKEGPCCIKDTEKISHFGHSGCTMSDKFEKKKSDPHYDKWVELIEKFATKKDGKSYYTFNKKWSDIKAMIKDWILAGNTNYTIEEIMTILNNKDTDKNDTSGNVIYTTGYELLHSHHSVFCLKHNQLLGRYHQYFWVDHYPIQSEYRFDISDYIETNGDDENTTFDTYDVTSYAVPNYSSVVKRKYVKDYMDIENDTENLKTLKSNVKYFLDKTYGQNYNTTQKIYRIYNSYNSPSNPYETNVFSYALAYSEKTGVGNSYLTERAQLGIWAVVGNPGYGEPGTSVTIQTSTETESEENTETRVENISDIENSGLYKVGGAIDEYEEALTAGIDSSDETYKHNLAVDGTDPRLKNNPVVTANTGNTHKVTSGINIGDPMTEPTGTTAFFGIDNKLYYRIGPFSMNDYALAYAKNNVPVEEYSGKELEYPKLIGGIISGTITFKDENGNNARELKIGSNSSIEPVIIYKSASDHGHTYNGNYIKKPSETEYVYPYPESTFYIEVAQDVCGEDAAILSEMSFEYRQTKTDGNGWVILSKYVSTTFERSKDNEGSKLSDCDTYMCDGGCYNNDIDVEVRNEEHAYFCREYSDDYDGFLSGESRKTTYCKYGGNENNFHEKCNNKDLKCTDSSAEHEHDAGCYKHKCAYFYCKHGYYNGKHNYTASNRRMAWYDTTAPTTCNHDTVCIDHKHEECYTVYWKNAEPKVVKGQPLLAVHDAYVKVVKTKVTSKFNIRLTTNITINKYIEKIEHSNEGVSSEMNSYKWYDQAYDSDIGFSSRETLPDQNKKNNPLKLERGDKITYKILLTNSSNIDVAVQVKDVLPSYCKFVEIDGANILSSKNHTSDDVADKYFVTAWIHVARNSTAEIEVVIIATASGADISDAYEDILNVNTATLVSSNKGRDLIGSTVSINDEHINYVRTSGEYGAVVNLAQIEGNNLYKVLKASDYYIVKSYNVVLDKFITEVRHANDQVTYNRYEGSLDVTTGTMKHVNDDYSDRDRYNDNQGKMDNPIYVEMGDRVTYDIDIQNTWYANAKEMEQNPVREYAILEEPYYAPNYIRVDIEDVLPSCYTPGSLRIEYIVRETWQGNDNYKKTPTSTERRFLIDNTIGTGTVTNFEINNLNLKVRDLYVNPSSEATLRISFVVSTNDTSSKYENKALVSKLNGGNFGNDLNFAIRNINDYLVYNTTNTGVPTRTEGSDYFVLNNYNAVIDHYISGYDDIKLQENVSNNFEVHYDENDLTVPFATTKIPLYYHNTNNFTAREMVSDTDKNNYPIDVEKYEELEYTIKVYNETRNEEEGASTNVSSNVQSDFKPATLVRVSSVLNIIDPGFEIDLNTVTAKICTPTPTGIVERSVAVTPYKVMEAIYPNAYVFNIHNTDNGITTLLQPGEYIQYTYKVKVTKTNMYLNNLKNMAKIEVLTNINNTSPNAEGIGSIAAPETTDHTSEVTNKNISTRQNSSDFARLKDLIIAGKVWLDFNKDGYMSKDDGTGNIIKTYDGLSSISNLGSSNVAEDKVMEGIIVKLYTQDGNLVRTAITDQNGLYTFARQDSSQTDYRTGLEQRIDKANGKDNFGNYTNNSQYLNYYIEFEYDGVLYKTTEIYGGRNEEGGTLPNYGRDNFDESWLPTNEAYKTDSNAFEFKDKRDEFNHRYEIITYNYAYAYNQPTINGDLTFDKNGHTSYLNVNHNRDMIARSFILQGSDYADASGTPIVGNTDLLWFYKDMVDNTIPAIPGTSPENPLPETEYLKYINLGLEEREDADISSTKDVYEVKTTINGEEMAYGFNQNVGVNGQATNRTHEGNYVIPNPYELKLYESDFEYRYDMYQNEVVRNFKGEESELNVEVTYRIRVDNNAIVDDELKNDGTYKDIKLGAKVHEIVDLYDENFVKYNDNPNEEITVKRKNVTDKELLEDTPTGNGIKIAEAWYIDASGNQVSLTLKNDSTYTSKSNDFTADGYNTLYISGMDNVVIEEGDHLDIFVKYVVDKKADRTLKIEDTKTDNKGIENIAQVNAYSIWDETGTKPKSIVDKDSNVGNVGIKDNSGTGVSADDKDFYEDTVYKTGIKFVVDSGMIREISGTAWNDARTEETTGVANKQYYGDGQYDTSKTTNANAKQNENVKANYDLYDGNKDIPLRNAKAEYLEIVKVPKPGALGEYLYYEEMLQGVTWAQKQNSRTDDTGNYNINGFIPGYYKVRFTYGDTVTTEPAKKDMLLFNGQDYKSTAYNGVTDADISGATNKYDKILAKLEETSKSDARDDEIRRLETIAYSETMINAKAEILKGTAKGTALTIADLDQRPVMQIGELKARLNENVIKEEELKELTDNTHMYADTVKFYVKPEKLKDLINPDSTTLAGLKPIYKDAMIDNILYDSLTKIEYEDVVNKVFNIENIDFGIEYRPETQVSLKKEISRIKLKTSDGKELINLKFETVGDELKIKESESIGKDYTQLVSNDYRNSTSLPNNLKEEDVQGFVYVNVDEEILQGATVEVEYRLTAINCSEIDRISENLSALKYKDDVTSADETYIRYVNLIGDYSLKKHDEIMSNETYVYTAAGTAATILTERDKYGKTTDTLLGTYYEKEKDQAYYGKYLGNFYYTGTIGTTDVIATLRFDKILDYVDTDFVFTGNTTNAKANMQWSAYTDEDLIGYVKNHSESDGVAIEDRRLSNVDGISFVTYDPEDSAKPLTSNLLVSVSDRLKETGEAINDSISTFLKPGYNGYIELPVSKVISSETDTSDMQYENLAEIIQYTTLTGRRTNFTTTIGNADISEGEFDEASLESDTAATETITFAPPTGLDRINRVIRDTVDVAGKGIKIIVIPVALVVGGIIITNIVIRKRKKRPIK